MGTKERRARHKSELRAQILDAARDTILRGGWRVLEDNWKSLILEKEGRQLRVLFIARLSRATFVRIQQQYGDRTVVLAVEIETPLTSGANTLVIDLMRSRCRGVSGNSFGGPADAAVRSLLEPFL